MEQQPTVAFLDLEETCIDEWAFGRLLPENLGRIKLFLDELYRTEECGVRIGLMSRHSEALYRPGRRFMVYQQSIFKSFRDPMDLG